MTNTTGEVRTETEAAETATTEVGEHPILFFDGVCGLCNRSVDFVLARDRARRFRYAPLQGETAGRLLDAGDTQDLNTMILRDESGRLYRRSSAVARVLLRLPGIWKALGAALWIVPRPLRDLGYKLIAKNRYRLFGKKESCRMPTPAERALFLM